MTHPVSANVKFLREHAYAYALPAGASLAEDYAEWFVKIYADEPEEDWPAHTTTFPEFRERWECEDHDLPDLS